MLLSSALGGDARAVIIVTASKDASHAAETQQTLRFGEECGAVRNVDRGSVASSLASLLAELQQKIEALEQQIKRSERWIQVKRTRQDFDAELGRVVEEVVVTTEIVGAEHLRRELEVLQARKQELLGAHTSPRAR